MEGLVSDHNWVFIYLTDHIVKKTRKFNITKRKTSWNISYNQDWSSYQSTLDKLVDDSDLSLDAAGLAARASEILLQAGLQTIGYRNSVGKTSMKSCSLPPFLVSELQLKRQMESSWKSKCSAISSLPPHQITEEMSQSLNAAEAAFQE